MKSRLYTRTGDDGTTSLVGGTRTPKDSLRLEAYGTVDELNSCLGIVASSEVISEERRAQLHNIQNRLFDIGAILATEPESAWQPSPLPAEAVAELESAIDDIDSSLPVMRQFILPGGHRDAAHAHLARTIARRAERRVVNLSRQTSVAPEVVKYLNRISDYLFALAREINIATSTDEIVWTKA